MSPEYTELVTFLVVLFGILSIAWMILSIGAGSEGWFFFSLCVFIVCFVYMPEDLTFSPEYVGWLIFFGILSIVGIMVSIGIGNGVGFFLSLYLLIICLVVYNWYMPEVSSITIELSHYVTAFFILF